MNPSPEAQRAILDARARALAVVPAAAIIEPQLELLVFRVGAERCAIESRHVREVASLSTPPTPLPGAPRALTGLINLRGDIMATAELAVILNLPPPADPRRQVLVVATDEGPLAIVADTVEAMIALPTRSVLPPAAPHSCIRGVTEDGLVVLIAESLFHSDAVKIS